MAAKGARAERIPRTDELARSEHQTQAKTIIVAGDIVVDHHIYQGARDTPSGPGRQGTSIRQETGGARLSFKILRSLSAKNSGLFAVEYGMASKAARGLVQSYSLLTPCPVGEGGKGSVWRVTGRLGYGDSVEGTTHYGNSPMRASVPASVVVIDDAALGFRHSINESAWPLEIRESAPSDVEWVVLKMAAPVAQGDLWLRLSKRFCDRLIVVVSASDLRQEEVSISEGLSWEDTAQDLLRELVLNKSISGLTSCRHLIISLGTDGALWMSRNGDGTHRYRLAFDPGGLEGAWAQSIEGQVWGGMSCLVSGIVAELVKTDVNAAGEDRASASGAGEPDIDGGIMRGLSAMRHLLRVGHGAVDGGRMAGGKAKHGFPPDPVVEDLVKPSSHYRITEVPSEVAQAGRSKEWTIISGEGGVGGCPLYGLGRRVALFGSRALVDEVPYARFGKMVVVDRVEIESLRGLERLIKGYEQDPRPPKKPLSIAVFGTPGSGKSFSVKQIAKEVLGDKVPILEFNLSQFSDPGELIGAFHQVRDRVLTGATPVVFWDEFDSREYMWLQYLLAPMQDGHFQEGQVTHPIGKCVFVFAGGTSYDFANFAPSEEEGAQAVAEASSGLPTGLTRFEKFKLAKGPDFVSRLNGYLNVAGPNRRQKYDTDRRQWVDDDDPPDLCFPVRRALLMRATSGFVGAAEGDEMDIDSGLLSAFLQVEKYKHGARSLETIMGLTRGAERVSIRRSALPPKDQLSLHVDCDEFMELVNIDLPFKMNSEELAPAVHEFYLELAHKKEFPTGFDVPFDQLPDDVKADNMAAAARIPRVLALAGLAVVHKERPATLPEKKVGEIIERNLELLAECEHDGYMEQKYRNGFSYGLIRDDKAKKHPSLVQYANLSEEDKEKDRNSVRHYPDIVKMAGYKIVEAGHPSRSVLERGKQPG